MGWQAQGKIPGLGRALMTLCTTKDRLRLFQHIVVDEDKNIANSLATQQFIHEAIEDTSLVTAMNEYVSTWDIRECARDKLRLFEVMAYIHHLSCMDKQMGFRDLCHSLQKAVPSDMSHEESTSSQRPPSSLLRIVIDL